MEQTDWSKEQENLEEKKAREFFRNLDELLLNCGCSWSMPDMKIGFGSVTYRVSQAGRLFDTISDAVPPKRAIQVVTDKEFEFRKSPIEKFMDHFADHSSSRS
jgi:hypothetical protein